MKSFVRLRVGQDDFQTMNSNDKERDFVRDLIKVNSGNDLATLTGMEPNEGVIVAVFPETVEHVYLGDSFRIDEEHTAFPIMAKLPGWGDRLLDIVTEPASAVKWWKVRDLAKQRGLDMVPERWQGAVVDIPERFWADGYILGIRLYNEGPWFWPKEQPIVHNAETKVISEMLDMELLPEEKK